MPDCLSWRSWKAGPGGAYADAAPITFPAFICSPCLLCLGKQVAGVVQNRLIDEATQIAPAEYVHQF
jgi:hypothetical protein